MSQPARGPDRTRPTPIPPGAESASAADVDWQTDAKHYEFWVRGDDDGHFTIPNVRPGTYTLHAIADGVLGEFAKTDITVAAGQAARPGSADLDARAPRPADLGHRHSQPQRLGILQGRRLSSTTAWPGVRRSSFPTT